jgi:hypothetical protein
MRHTRTVFGVAWLLALTPLTVAFAQSPPRNTYPLTLTRGSRLMVDAEVNGRAVLALLDSAAEVTLIDRGFAHDLKLGAGETVAGQGSGDASFDADLIKGVQLRAFGISLANQSVAVVDLGDVGRRLLGQRLDVILGREIFDAARLRIDIEGRRVEVLPPDSKPPGVYLPLSTEHAVETIPARVEGVGPVQATFDLGNGSEVLVGEALARRLRVLSDGRTVTSGRGGGLGGETARRRFVLHSLKVAGRNFTNVPAAIDAHSSASDLNIGVAILRHFVITTDFASHAMWLEPRR